MMLVVHRLQEIEWKAGVSLFMYFTGFKMVYDILDQTLLKQVLTRIGISPQMLAVINNSTMR